MNATAAEAWSFQPDPASTREARRRVCDRLEAAALEGAVPSVALVVSELTTNAVLHARTAFEVRLHLGMGTIRIEVHDEDSRRPVARNFSESATSGRGLRVVDQLCEAWGVEPDADGPGKTVWAVLPIDGDPFAAFDLSSVDAW